MSDGRGAAVAGRDIDGCVRMFTEFAKTTAHRAPLYARLSAGIAEDRSLAGLLLTAPPTQRQPVLLLGCVHELLLTASGSEELARYYPNLTSDPDPGDPVPAFRELCRRRSDELAELLRARRTQTNEIGRCALLLPAFGLLADEMGVLAHLDVGTSAGLTLLLDRYRYVYEPGGQLGADSPVTMTCGTRGNVPVPATVPEIGARRGIDHVPVDVGDEAQSRWLEACVWPDQIDRFERLRAAIQLAQSTELDVQLGDAVNDTAGHVRELGAHGHPVVTNTWVLNYLTGPQRQTYVDVLDGVGQRLDLSWVYLESPFLTPELPGPQGDAALDRTVLVLVRWRAGQRTIDHLADAHPHGYWLHWTS